MTLQHTPRLVLPVLPVLAAVLLAGCQSTSTTHAPARGQTTAADPNALTLSLVSAVEQSDREALRSLFGPRASELRAEGPDQNARDLQTFARQLGEGWEVAPTASTSEWQEAELLVGSEKWPFAVPLVSDGTRWWFDTDTGVDELTSRRVGRNELKTIEALMTLIDAQRTYFSRDHDGDGVSEYAARLMSTPGTHDGLHWPAPGGVDPSPIGPDMAMAASRTDASGARLPFWGYRYQLLTGLGAGTPGGVGTFQTANGLTGGWGVVAYPSDYGNTGVMSFMTSHQGVIYERDLGSGSATAATRMSTFDPNGWSVVGARP